MAPEEPKPILEPEEPPLAKLVKKPETVAVHKKQAAPQTKGISDG